jgi:hypothetical protein
MNDLFTIPVVYIDNGGQFLKSFLYIFLGFYTGREDGGGGASYSIHFHSFPYPSSVFVKLGLNSRTC